jgi:hypothetical protein
MAESEQLRRVSGIEGTRRNDDQRTHIERINDWEGSPAYIQGHGGAPDDPVHPYRPHDALIEHTSPYPATYASATPVGGPHGDAAAPAASPPDAASVDATSTAPAEELVEPGVEQLVPVVVEVAPEAAVERPEEPADKKRRVPRHPE